ncbi:MAG: phosphate ABC transporter substrate-binding protein [Gammaproteobacteria bacterium]|nr:phosphate ABC transporter substrate-binding protein [Gammaproteobacteria bacterium]
MFRTFLLTGAILSAFISGTANADLAIISHPEYEGDKLELINVKRLFLGERQSFPNGHKASPIHHAVGSPDRKDFFISVLGMSESSHKRHWKRMTSTGRGSSPNALNSYEEILEWVKDTPGSITYINADKVDDSVKVLLVIEDYDNL